MRWWLQSRTLAFVVVVWLAGCGPTVRVSPEFRDMPPAVFAVLPVEYPPTVPRERALAVAEAIEERIRGRGVALVRSDTVRRVCSSPECTERRTLASRYGVNGFFRVVVNASNRRNFIAGYFHTVQGQLRLEDVMGRELLAVEGTTRERGGLLFSSGQVIEGLRASIENAEGKREQPLADRFASDIVEHLPALKSPTLAMVDPLQGKPLNVIIGRMIDDRVKVCGTGPDGLDVALLIGKRRAELVPIAMRAEHTEYCGEFFLSGLLNDAALITVEFRSPLGSVRRIPASITRVMTCDPRGLVAFMKGAVRIGCDSIAAGAERKQCEEKLTGCQRFQIYGSQGAPEPFVKIASVAATVREVRPQPVPKSVVVLAVSKDGTKSLPVEAHLEDEKKR